MILFFCPPLPIAPCLQRYLAAADRYLLKQTEGSARLTPGEHIDALGSLARILEATLCRSGKTTRSTNRSVGCWLGKEAGKVGIKILIKLQSVSLTPVLKHINTTCLFLPGKAQAALKSQSWWPCPQPLAFCTITQAKPQFCILKQVFWRLACKKKSVTLH